MHRLFSPVGEQVGARAQAGLLRQVCRALAGPHPSVLWEGAAGKGGEGMGAGGKGGVGKGARVEGGEGKTGKAGGSKSSGKGKGKGEGKGGAEEASRLKEQGNELFRAQDGLAAARMYSAALAQLDTDGAAVLLSNRAACFLSLGQEQPAAVAAAAAVLLDAKNIKVCIC